MHTFAQRSFIKRKEIRNTHATCNELNLRCGRYLFGIVCSIIENARSDRHNDKVSLIFKHCQFFFKASFVLEKMAQKIELEEKVEGETLLQNGQPGSNNIKMSCWTKKKMWVTIGAAGTCVFISIIILVVMFVLKKSSTVDPPTKPSTEPSTKSYTKSPTEPSTEPFDIDYVKSFHGDDYENYDNYEDYDQIGGSSRADANITKVCLNLNVLP